MKKVRRIDEIGLPRNNPEPTLIVDITQTESGLRAIDRHGRITGVFPPCSYCQFAILSENGPGVFCRAGVENAMDIRTSDANDPEAHGWPGENSRPLSDREAMYGYHETFIATLGMWGTFSGTKPNISEIISRFVRSGLPRELVEVKVLHHLRKIMAVSDNMEDDITALIRRALGSEDTMDIAERSKTFPEDLERLHNEYHDGIDEPPPVTDTYPYQAGIDNFTPVSRHYLVRVRSLRIPELSSRNDGWVKVRSFITELPIPDIPYHPHPDENVALTTYTIALRDSVICPMSLRKLTTLRSVYSAASWRKVDRVLAGHIARALGYNGRNNVVNSRKVGTAEQLKQIVNLSLNESAAKAARSVLRVRSFHK